MSREEQPLYSDPKQDHERALERFRGNQEQERISGIIKEYGLEVSDQYPYRLSGPLPHKYIWMIEINPEQMRMVVQTKKPSEMFARYGRGDDSGTAGTVYFYPQKEIAIGASGQIDAEPGIFSILGDSIYKNRENSAGRIPADDFTPDSKLTLVK